MVNYYVDCETTGLNPNEHKIITIQFAELQRNSAVRLGPLTILKEWEMGEKRMIESFIEQTKATDSYAFTFVPVGYNLSFDHNFLFARSKANDLIPIDILSRPFIDLRVIGILMNRGEFKGSSLDSITGKKQNGSMIPQWYANKQYDLIEEYITNEAEEFIKFCSWLYQRMPEVSVEYLKSIAKV